MDVKKKLVELLFASLCRHIDKSCKLAENIADDLIADGVTVQEWSSVTNPPTEPGEYIVMIKNGAIPTTLLYDGDFWFDEDEDGEFVHYAVTHWMPMPQPPKGE